jgi:hypothetical protein
VKNGHVLHAEIAARELGSLSPSAALSLVLLYQRTGDGKFEHAHSQAIPSRAQLAEADLVLIVGELSNGDAALALGGRLKLALEDGATVIYAYSARLTDVDRLCFDQLVPDLVGQQLSGSARPVPDEGLHPAFRTYLLEHGRTDYGFSDTVDAEVLARAPDQPRMVSAFAATRGRGSVYVVPIHIVGGFGEPGEALIAAVVAHRESESIPVPVFLDELALPDEAELREKITQAESQLVGLREAHDALTRHKQLLSHAASSAFERLAIDELKIVLAGSGLTARDTIEQFIEDFEIVDDHAAIQIIAEAKGDEAQRRVRKHRPAPLAPRRDCRHKRRQRRARSASHRHRRCTDRERLPK